MYRLNSEDCTKKDNVTSELLVFVADSHADVLTFTVTYQPFSPLKLKDTTNNYDLSYKIAISNLVDTAPISKEGKE